MSKDPKTIRCIICDSEFTYKEIEDINCCPNCGCKDSPCSIQEDLKIKINWHELRILTIWASNWAYKMCEESSVTCLEKIIGRLNKQKPSKEFAPLTLKEEAQELANYYGNDVELSDFDGGTKIIKPHSKFKN